MAEIQKIYRGMQNGAETINDNFKAIDERVKSLELTGDQDWTDLTPLNSFKVDGTSKLQYCIEKGVLYINIQGVVTPAIALATPAVIAKLPFAIKSTHNFSASVASSSGSGRYANSSAVIFVSTDGSISVNSYVAINEGQRVWGSSPVPRFKG